MAWLIQPGPAPACNLGCTPNGSQIAGFAGLKGNGAQLAGRFGFTLSRPRLRRCGAHENINNSEPSL